MRSLLLLVMALRSLLMAAFELATPAAPRDGRPPRLFAVTSKPLLED